MWENTVYENLQDAEAIVIIIIKCIIRTKPHALIWYIYIYRQMNKDADAKIKNILSHCNDRITL